MTEKPTEIDSGNAGQNDDGLVGRLTDLDDTRRGVLEKTAAVGAAVGLGMGATGSVAGHKEEDENGGQSMADATFQNQQSDGELVNVEHAELSQDGYIAIHDKRLLAGKVIESVIGVSDYLEEGVHEDIEIPLFRDVKGADFEKEELEESQPLVAMPHRETSGNKTYDFVESGGKKDGPFVDDGHAVVDLAFITVQGVATVAFENQMTDGKTVMVESTRLSDAGFIAIHDKRIFKGKVIESVIGVSEFLEVGTHEDVEVQLFNVKGATHEKSQLQKTQPLVAMPHLDTNGNKEYDFVETGGAKDGPYTRNGDAVVDLAFAVVDDEN